MRTRTKNGLILGAITLAAAAGLWAGSRGGAQPARASALDAVPAGALLVAWADLRALRGSPVFSSVLGEGREIPGLGPVRDVCGFDPADTLTEVAFAVPAAGETGDFGVAATGPVEADALIECASKVIKARGGEPVVTPLGSFRSVRDASLTVGGGEIAARSGLVVLGGGAYLRAMLDAADRRAPTLRSSVAHASLAEDLGGAAIRVTAVLTPEQRRTLAEELDADGAAGSPAKSIVAGAIGLSVAPGGAIEATGSLRCEDPRACAALADVLRRAKDERAADFATRLLGVGQVLEQTAIAVEDGRVTARVQMPADQAKVLFERVMALRSFRHPLPEGPAFPAPPELQTAPDPRPAPPPPVPDLVIAPPRGSASGRSN